MTSAAAASSPNSLTLEAWHSRMKELDALVMHFQNLPGKSGGVNTEMQDKIISIVANLRLDQTLPKNLKIALSKWDECIAKMRSGNANVAAQQYRSQLEAIFLGVVSFASSAFPNRAEISKLCESVLNDDVESVTKFGELQFKYLQYVPFSVSSLTSLDKKNSVSFYGIVAFSGAEKIQRYLSTFQPNLNLGVFPVKNDAFCLFPSLFAAVGSSTIDNAKKYRVVQHSLNDGANPLLTTPQGVFWLSRFAFSAELTHQVVHLMLSRVKNMDHATSNGITLLHHYTEAYTLKGQAQPSDEEIEREVQLANAEKGETVVQREKEAWVEKRYKEVLTYDDLLESIDEDPGLADSIRDNCQQEWVFEEAKNAKIRLLRKWHTRFNENVAVMIYHDIPCPNEITAKVNGATSKVCVASNVTAATKGKHYAYFWGDQWSNLPVTQALGVGTTPASSFPHVYEIPVDTATKAKQILKREKRKLPEVINVIKQCFKSVQDPKASSPTADLSGAIALIIMEKLDPRVMIADSCYWTTFQKPEWME